MTEFQVHSHLQRDVQVDQHCGASSAHHQQNRSVREHSLSQRSHVRSELGIVSAADDG